MFTLMAKFGRARCDGARIEEHRAVRIAGRQKGKKWGRKQEDQGFTEGTNLLPCNLLVANMRVWVDTKGSSWATKHQVLEER